MRMLTNVIDREGRSQVMISLDIFIISPDLARRPTLQIVPPM